MRVVHIPFGELANATATVLPFLRKAAAMTDGNCAVDDMMARLYAREQQLWALVDETGVRGILTTEVMRYPRAVKLRLGSIVMEPGSFEAGRAHIVRFVDDLALENQCAGIEFIGRAGWERVLKDAGYDKPSFVYSKGIDHGQG